MLSLWAAAAWGAEVVVVTSPGTALEAYTPLIEALHVEGHTTEAVTFACGTDDAAAMAKRVASAVEPGQVVVAHGLGATLALVAAKERPAASYVLLAPVLGVQAPEGSVLAWLATQSVGNTLLLSAAPAAGGWRGQHPAEVLLGPGSPALGCVSAAFAREVQGWIRAGAVPVDLSAVQVPVTLAVSLGDDVSSPETTIPVSRGLSTRKVVRLGLNRLDPVDFTHGQMLTHPIPLRWAARAVSGDVEDGPG